MATMRRSGATAGLDAPRHGRSSGARRPLLLLFGVTALAACRDTTATERSVADAAALSAAARPALPVHIRQSFVPETGHPEYALVPCGSGAPFPNRFRAEGVLTPHMGRTVSVLTSVACSVGPDSIRIGGLARHAGATGDVVYGLWSGFVTNLQGGTGALTIHLVLLGGTGRFQHTIGDVQATGEIDLSTRTGRYAGSGTLRDRPPLPPGAVQLRPETITSGNFYSCGLDVEGAAYCWGKNDYGQLGDGTTTARAVPTRVAGGLTFTQISAASGYFYGHHTCGITTSGAAYCWGGNTVGQLGDNTTTERHTPTAVYGGLVFKQVSAGDVQTCGLTTSGAAYCWGWNDVGQLGNGEMSLSGQRNAPVAVVGGITFEQISAGGSHTCGVADSGTVYCWGWNYYGQLGRGWYGNSASPVPVQGGLLFKDVAAGEHHTCGVTTLGVGLCWGRNEGGALGVGTTSETYSAPAAVSGGIIFDRITAGTQRSCGLTPSGSAYCWGDGYSAPVPVQGGLRFAQIDDGKNHRCGVSVGGVGYCWGAGGEGQLGDGTATTEHVPVVVGKLPVPLDRLSGGGYHTCALTLSGAAYCWGANYEGQLGDGTTVQRFNPAVVLGEVAFHQISSGYGHSCGLTVHGVAYCWGDNSSGQLGDGTQTDRTAPTLVAGGLVFSRIGAGAEHTCGIANTGVAYCWGNNAHGQLGDGTTTPRHTPTAVSGGQLFAELTVGSDHACALTNAGAAHCWGSDGVIEHHVPLPVEGDLAFTQLSAGERFTCGLSGGAAYCWGSNSGGQLGDGTTFNHPFPAPVSGDRQFTELTTGESHTCALTATGSAYCWGWNSYAQLGDGTTSRQTTPVAVAGGLAFSRIGAGLHHTCGMSGGTPYCWGRGDYGQTGGGIRPVPTIVTALSFRQ